MKHGPRSCAGNVSDDVWAVSEVMIWDYAISSSEMEAVSRILLRRLNQGPNASAQENLCHGSALSSSETFAPYIETFAPYMGTDATCYFRSTSGAICSSG